MSVSKTLHPLWELVGIIIEVTRLGHARSNDRAQPSKASRSNSRSKLAYSVSRWLKPARKFLARKREGMRWVTEGW